MRADDEEVFRQNMFKVLTMMLTMITMITNMVMMVVKTLMIEGAIHQWKNCVLKPPFEFEILKPPFEFEKVSLVNMFAHFNLLRINQILLYFPSHLSVMMMMIMLHDDDDDDEDDAYYDDNDDDDEDDDDDD